MRRVCRSKSQVLALVEEMLATVETVPLMVDVTPYKPPHTSDQNAKVHAMISDLASFTGYTADEMKSFIKLMGFWPEQTVTIGGVSKRIPKSASAKAQDPISREEESTIIEYLYQVGASLPGFQWSKP